MIRDTREELVPHTRHFGLLNTATQRVNAVELRKWRAIGGEPVASCMRSAYGNFGLCKACIVGHGGKAQKRYAEGWVCSSLWGGILKEVLKPLRLPLIGQADVWRCWKLRHGRRILRKVSWTSLLVCRVHSLHSTRHCFYWQLENRTIKTCFLSSSLTALLSPVPPHLAYSLTPLGNSGLLTYWLPCEKHSRQSIHEGTYD